MKILVCVGSYRKNGNTHQITQLICDAIQKNADRQHEPLEIETIYLGVTTTPGTTFTGTYTDLTYGGTYSHVPLPGTVLLLGPGLVCFAALKRLLKKK